MNSYEKLYTILSEAEGESPRLDPEALKKAPSSSKKKTKTITIKSRGSAKKKKSSTTFDAFTQKWGAHMGISDSVYEKVYNLLVEAGMPEKKALKRGLRYKNDDPAKPRLPGFQSDATVKGKPVVVRHGWKSSKRKPKKKSQESHATVRIKSAGEGDYLKGRRGKTQKELKASMKSRKNR